MPKRSHSDEDSNEYLRKKVRKLEKKLEKRKKRSRRSRTRELSSGSEGHASRARAPSPPPPPPPAVADEYELGLEPSVEYIDIEDEPETSNHYGVPNHASVADTSQQGLQAPTFDSTNADIGPSANTSANTGANTGANDSANTAAAEAPDEEIIILDDEILEMLGKTPSKEKIYAPKIQKDLALRWEFVASSGLTKEERKELLEKHLVPENCKKVDAPLLNAEIKAALNDTLTKKDKAIENKQCHISAAISCIGEALTNIFSQNNKDTSVIKLLIEAGRIMCDVQHTESMNRRSFICGSIKKDIKDHLYETDIDKYLFGEKLSETLRSAKAISKSGAEIKFQASAKNTATASRPKGSRPFGPLNSKPPLPYNAGTSVGRWQTPAHTQPAAPFRRRAPPTRPPPPPPPQQQRSQYRAPQRRQ